MRRRVLGLAVAVVTLAGAAGCGSSDSGSGGASSAGGAEKTQVTVGVIPIVDVAPLYLGQKKGFFAERGIELKMVTAQGVRRSSPGW